MLDPGRSWRHSSRGYGNIALRIRDRCRSSYTWGGRGKNNGGQEKYNPSRACGGIRVGNYSFERPQMYSRYAVRKTADSSCGWYKMYEIHGSWGGDGGKLEGKRVRRDFVRDGDKRLANTAAWGCRRSPPVDCAGLNSGHGRGERETGGR